jgi:hypothetical protein
MASKYSKQIADNVEATKVPTALDIAWIAGFYEGEGSASGIKGRTIVQVAQKDPEILFRCRELFGGTITLVRMNTPHYCHTWKQYGDRARIFFAAIYPYMSVRRKLQIEKAGGLRFTGFAQPIRGAMSEERKTARASMTPQERQRETMQRYIERNDEKRKAYQREYQRNKRACRQVLNQNLPVSQVIH